MAVEDLVYACEVFATVDEFFACGCDCEVDAGNPEHVALVEEALTAASDQLCLMSAHTVRGICSQIVTTCRERCSCGLSGYGYGSGFRSVYGYGSECKCRLDVIYLPGPIVAVSGIGPTVPGSWDYVFNPADFVIVDDIGVAWAPGADPTLKWPPGVMIDIEYGFGPPVDSFVKESAIDLACASVKKCISDACALGINPGSVTRQGITISRQAVSGLADIRRVAVGQFAWMARFLATYNPEGAVMPPWLWSPDLGDVKILRTL